MPRALMFLLACDVADDEVPWDQLRCLEGSFNGCAWPPTISPGSGAPGTTINGSRGVAFGPPALMQTRDPAQGRNVQISYPECPLVRTWCAQRVRLARRKGS